MHVIQPDSHHIIPQYDNKGKFKELVNSFKQLIDRQNLTYSDGILTCEQSDIFKGRIFFGATRSFKVGEFLTPTLQESIDELHTAISSVNEDDFNKLKKSNTNSLTILQGNCELFIFQFPSRVYQVTSDFNALQDSQFDKILNVENSLTDSHATSHAKMCPWGALFRFFIVEADDNGSAKKITKDQKFKAPSSPSRIDYLKTFHAELIKLKPKDQTLKDSKITVTVGSSSNMEIDILANQLFVVKNGCLATNDARLKVINSILDKEDDRNRLKKFIRTGIQRNNQVFGIDYKELKDCDITQVFTSAIGVSKNTRCR